MPRTLPELIRQGRDSWARLARLDHQALGGDVRRRRPHHRRTPSAGTRRSGRPAEEHRLPGPELHRATRRKARRRAAASSRFRKHRCSSPRRRPASTAPTIRFRGIRPSPHNWTTKPSSASSSASPARTSRARDALDHVFGYTVINDVSARDLQKTHLQWFKGKSLDGFCPIGPVIVTADEFGDPQSKKISLQGQRRREAELDDGEHDLPGGRHHRVAVAGHDPRAGRRHRDRHARRRRPRAARRQEFLQDGDLVETEVEGIGVMRNRVVRTKT